MADRNDRAVPASSPASPGAGRRSGPGQGEARTGVDRSSRAPATGVAAAVAGPSAPPRAFLAAAYTFAVVLGAALGLYGAFLAPAGPRLGGVLFSIGVALAVVGNGGAVVLLAWLTGTRLGAGLLLLGWAPVVLWFGGGRPEGDLVLPSGATSYAFLLAGIFVPVVVSVVVRPTRGLFGPLSPLSPPR